MIQLAREREELRIIGDQFGAPTSAELIADITALCLFQIANHNISTVRATGTYNLAAMGETSWHGFAKYLISKAWDSGLQLSTRPDKVTPITTAEYPLPAMRPENSRLNTQKLCGMFHLKLPVWQTHAQRLVNELAHTLSC
jgi:dTDP-4-dehydrorhamnose reductase